MNYRRIQAPHEKTVIFQNRSFSFNLYCTFSQGKTCILEELQHEPSFSEEETEWTGLYWSLILQQDNHTVDKLTAIRPYGDCSIKNLKFSCVLNSRGYFIRVFCLSFACVFFIPYGHQKVLKSCKIFTRQITNIFLIHERKMYLVSRVTNDIQKFFFPKKWAEIWGGKM